MTGYPSPNIPVLTISQLTNAIKMSLESTFPSVWIQGEISNCKLQSSGHLYFSLKDAQAQISAIMFRGDLSSLKMTPKDGAQVIVRGELNVYPPTGKYQIVIRELRYSGTGELLLRLEELKHKLHQKGWFKSDRKKPLPKCPARIGVVTSPTGAVIQDILNILSRRLAGFQLILNPVKVQGEGAAQEIAQAIEQFNRYQLADVLIVGRGGGSIEDLWAFNEEVVAEAIFKSRIPIISAVGHETDHCIADYVADVRAPTPSAAAELVSAERSQYNQYLAQVHHRLHQSVCNLIRNDKRRLDSLKKLPLFTSPYALLGPAMQRLDDFRLEIDTSMKRLLANKHLLLETKHKRADALRPSAQIIHLRQKLFHFEKSLYSNLTMRIVHFRNLLLQKSDRMNHSWQAKYLLRKERLEKMAATLHAIDPKNLLGKGYCILFAEKDRSVITSVSEIQRQQEVRALLADGEVLATVKDLFPK